MTSGFMQGWLHVGAMPLRCHIWKRPANASQFKMTLKLLPLIALTFLFGCNQPTEKSNNIFIVPSDSMLFAKRTPGEPPPPPPPPKIYYFPSNLIIDTGEHIYYYQQQIQTGWVCGTGMDWDIPPSFIDLQPKDIVEIPSEAVEMFIKANIQFIDKSDRQFAIASTVDTITSVGLSKILSIFKDTSNHITWTFRRTTQEENMVLSYKKRKERYYADEVKWDSTKTLFPSKFENIKFTPPDANGY